ncbi:MAG TPA: tyrosine-type recombinase/integrase [Gemmatimonadales bacterium]|nr:tyrosine-type recombinase/integrase [Gemmatimonadales bacterium]
MARSKKAPGHFERRGQSWRWRVCVGGKYHRYTVPTADRREAEAWARKKFEELDRHRVRATDGLAVGVRMGDLLRYFEMEKLPRLAPGTQLAYRDSLKPIRTFFVERLRDPMLERVRRADVGDYLDWRRTHRLDGTKPLHNRTLAKDRAVLHLLFEVAQEREWREGNPVGQVRVEKSDSRQPVILTQEQYDALVTACHDPMVRLYVLFTGETGARCESEVLWLRWEDVDLDAGFVNIVSGRNGHRVKGGRSRHVPMTAQLRDALRAHFARCRFAAYDGVRPEYVFHHEHTRRRSHAGDRVQSFRFAVRVAAQLAEVPAGWVMHDLRHRRITTWLAEGKSVVLVKEAVGHADLKTTMHYMHLVKEHLRALVEPKPASQAVLG